MAIFGIGAYYEKDVSQDFIGSNLVGVGWGNNDAPELHQFMKALKVGDIVYIKSYPPNRNDIIVKAIGIIIDDQIVTTTNTRCGRNVRWILTKEFHIPRPNEKNNVRSNTMYEEYHPEVQQNILNRIYKDANT